MGKSGDNSTDVVRWFVIKRNKLILVKRAYDGSNK